MGIRISALVFSAAVLASVAAITSACSDDTARSARREDATSSIAFALSGGDFTGNSVRICGSRTQADGKYRCNSQLSAQSDGGGDGCGCFEFDSTGAVLDPNGILAGLCPSVDVPTSDWTFSYEIWSATGCTGTQLNDGTHDLVCYDSKDFASQANPNQSIEPLAIGANANQILCVTANAKKSFQFESCAIVDVDAGAGYDCGCTPVDGGTCSCPGGLAASDLQAGCSFDSTTCNILCN